MCKIIIIPKINETETVKKFLRALVPDFTQHDNDGLGYVALNRNGTLSGERWRYPNEAFQDLIDVNAPESKAYAEIGASLDDFDAAPRYNAFGVDSGEWSALLYHSRFATCAKSIENTHPFIDDASTTALVHNGVITKSIEEWKPKRSTCDSEILLNGYVASGVSDNAQNFDNVASGVSGYYALGVLAKSTSGAWCLDVVKDCNAELQAIFVNELQCIVYCTNAEIITKACALLKWSCAKAYDVKDNAFIRYDALTGNVLSQHEIDVDDFDAWERSAFDCKTANDNAAFQNNTLTENYSSAIDRDDDFQRNAWCDDFDRTEWTNDALVVNKCIMQSDDSSKNARDAGLNYDNMRKFRFKRFR